MIKRLSFTFFTGQSFVYKFPTHMQANIKAAKKVIHRALACCACRLCHLFEEPTQTLQALHFIQRFRGIQHGKFIIVIPGKELLNQSHCPFLYVDYQLPLYFKHHWPNYAYVCRVPGIFGLGNIENMLLCLQALIATWRNVVGPYPGK